MWNTLLHNHSLCPTLSHTHLCVFLRAYGTHNRSERAKIELDSLPETDINLPYITVDATGPQHMNITLKRSTYENLCKALIDRTIPACKACLKDAGISQSDIQEVCVLL